MSSLVVPSVFFNSVGYVSKTKFKFKDLLAKIHETRALLEAQLGFQVLLLTVLFQKCYNSIRYMIKKIYSQKVENAVVAFRREKVIHISQ